MPDATAGPPAVSGDSEGGMGRRAGAGGRAEGSGGSNPIRVERSGPVTTVILDRPQVRNAVDGPTAAALAKAFSDFDADPDSSVAVLFGAGGTFCAGADLKAMGGPDGSRTEPGGHAPLGGAADRRRHGPAAARGRAGPGARHDPDRARRAGRGGAPDGAGHPRGPERQRT